MKIIRIQEKGTGDPSVDPSRGDRIECFGNSFFDSKPSPRTNVTRRGVDERVLVTPESCTDPVVFVRLFFIPVQIGDRAGSGRGGRRHRPPVTFTCNWVPDRVV